MHYKNGREAKNGDPVVGNIWGNITAGIIHSINPAMTNCNCTVAVPVMGGITQLSCQNVNWLYHAEDAYVAVEASFGEAKPSPAGSPPATPSPGGWPQPESPGTTGGMTGPTDPTPSAAN
jgi:hypothetical protein